MLSGRSIKNAGTVDQGQTPIARTQLMSAGESQLVTLYGIDVASYQTGLNLAEVKAEGFDFLIAKATEGSGYVDPYWASFRDGAYANDLILVATTT